MDSLCINLVVTAAQWAMESCHLTFDLESIIIHTTVKLKPPHRSYPYSKFYCTFIANFKFIQILNITEGNKDLTFKLFKDIQIQISEQNINRPYNSLSVTLNIRLFKSN